MWNAVNWSNTAGLCCFSEGVLRFVTTGHSSVALTLTSRKGCSCHAGSCTKRSYNSSTRIPMTAVTNITSTNSLTYEALIAVGTLHDSLSVGQLEEHGSNPTRHRHLLPFFQTDSGAYKAFNSKNTRGPSDREKGGGTEKLTIGIRLMQRLRTKATVCHCNTRFALKKFYVLPTQRIYVFCVHLRTNSDYFPIQH